MSKYSILIHPDKRLRITAKPVSEFNADLKTITDNMFETMYDSNGIGLAATQVNIHQRIVVMDVPRARDEAPNNQAEQAQEPQQQDSQQTLTHDKLILINPEIIDKSEQTATHQEGCLSIPEQFADVTRPAHITFRYQDIDGTTHEREAEGLLAVCVQHEIDHLNGVLFIDHLSQLKRQSLEKKLQKMLKAQANL